MPWKVYQENGQYCVHKLKDDGSKGPLVPGGCHTKKGDAVKHQKALYTNVEGEGVILRRRPSAPKPKKVTAEDAALVTVPDVEIVSVGEYDLASGKTTFTEEDLAAAVAAQDDPAVSQPRLKIGHTSKFGDGEPSFGTITNMRLADNNQKIVGDYTGVPKWLAEIMPTAYPSRSIEGGFDVQTASGSKHQLVITAVALLGVVAPGVSDIEDLVQMYGAEPPDEVVVEARELIEAKADGGAIDISAAMNIEDIRRAYYDQLDAGQAYWWVRTMQLDPNQLIVDDDDGHLYQVGFAVADGDVTFSDPEEVKIEYVPVAASTSHSGRVAASYASRSESRPRSTESEASMDLAPIRERLGLSEDTSDEDVLSAAEEALPARSDDDDDEEPAGESSSEPGQAEEETDEESEDEETTAASNGDGTVKVDSEEFKRLQDQARQGAEARQQQIASDREAILTAAVKQGRIPPARKEHYAKLFASDPEGTRTLLTAAPDQGGLAPNTVPVSEDGGAPGDDSLSASAYDQSWLSPAERARAQGSDAPGVITQEAA